MKYYAHILDGFQENDWETTQEHLDKVFEKCAEFLSEFEFSNYGEIVGFLHDLGKNTKAYQNNWDYIINKKPNRPIVDHATAGAKAVIEYSKEYARENGEDIEAYKTIGLILAYVIAGHHGKLPDWDLSNISLENQLSYFAATGRDLMESTLKHRLDKKIIETPNISSIKMPKFNFKLPSSFKFSRETYGAFCIQFLIRMIYSALVDADRLRTEEFCSPAKYIKRVNNNSLANLHDKFFENYTKKFRSPNANSLGRINKMRNYVFDTSTKICNKDNRSILTLTVPTGLGKTYASIGRALKYGEKNNKRRIFYISPMTAIISQNVKEIRDMVGEKNVLEHHSNIDFKRGSKYDLATENWDFPIICTTTVSFFDSFYSRKASVCRKLHSVANSIVIMDEIQLIPIQRLKQILAVIEELSKNYNVHFILMSATMPAIRKNDLISEKERNAKHIPKENITFRDFGLEDTVEIMENGTIPIEKLFSGNQRINIKGTGKNPNEIEQLTLNQVCNILVFNGHDQFFVISNTTKICRNLYIKLKNKLKKLNRKTDNILYHLSSKMCPKHKDTIIADVKKRLKDKLPCILVSTSVIEAGVNLSFPIGYKELCGIDSENQAGGRVNREGEFGFKGGTLYLIRIKDDEIDNKGETYLYRHQIYSADHYHHSGNLNLVTDYGCIKNYYKNYYKKYNIEIQKNDKNTLTVDKDDIIKYCKLNNSKIQEGKINFSVFNNFRMIENITKSIIVPFDKECQNIINELKNKSAIGASIGSIRTITRMLQRYILEVPSSQVKKKSNPGIFEKLNKLESFEWVSDYSLPFLKKSAFEKYYSKECGLNEDAIIENAKKK